MALRNEKGQFVKGHEELPPEQKLKRSISLRESAKKRKDYIADIVKQHPYIYNTWRGIMFTEKGKRIGVDEKWKDYRSFYNDVVETYQKGLLFRRPDVTKPYSPDNFAWVTKDVASDLKAGIYITIGDETLNLSQWSEKTGLPRNAMSIRYHSKKKKYTPEEIVYGVRGNRDSKKPKDISDPSVKIRAKASKMISSYKCRDKKLGFDSCDITIEWMIDNILTQKCVYCGDDKRIGCDRIDNKKGHTIDNVVPCCVECNAARNNFFSFEEMKEIGNVIREIKRRRKVK